MRDDHEVTEFRWEPGGECFHCGESLRDSRQRMYCIPCKAVVAEAARASEKVVSTLIRKKEIPHPRELQCVDCGGMAEHYDHRDYGRPEDVNAVCRQCNFGRGPAAISGFTRPEVPRGWRGDFAVDHGNKMTTTKAMQIFGIKSRNELARLLGFDSFWDLGSTEELKVEARRRVKALSAKRHTNAA